MELTDKLIISAIWAQSKEMIAELESNNEKLESCRAQFQTFLDSDELQGDGYAAAKKQVEDSLFLINAMIIANNRDIDQYHQYNKLVGIDTLDGSILVKEMNDYYNKMKEAESERASYVNRLSQEAGNNPFLIIYYKYMIQRADSRIEMYESFYEARRKKCLKFDAIAERTLGIFDHVSNLRNAIRTGMDHVAAQFDGKKYVMDNNSSWKEPIRVAANQCLKDKKVSLTKPFVEVVDENGKSWYGGCQEWFQSDLFLKMERYKTMKDGKGFYKYVHYQYGNHDSDMFAPETLEAIRANGSQLMALLNVQYYMNNVSSVDKAQYIDDTLTFLEEHKVFFYDTYYVRGYWKYFFPEYVKTKDNYFNKDMDEDIQSYMDSIAKAAGYKGATWTDSLEVELDVIKRQIAHDIPVLYSVSYDLEFEENVELYEKKPDGCIQRLEFRNTSDLGVVMKPTAGLSIVTITGVEQYTDVDSGNDKTLFKISLWGKELYVDYDQLSELKKNYNDRYLGHVGIGVEYGVNDASRVDY